MAEFGSLAPQAGSASAPVAPRPGMAEILAAAWNDPHPQGIIAMLQGMGRGVTAPGRAFEGGYSGMTEQDYAQGTTPQSRMHADAMGLTSAAVTGGMPMAARGALGMAGGRPSVPQVPRTTSQMDELMRLIDETRQSVPAAEWNAGIAADRMRRQMGVENRPTGDPQFDAVMKAIDDALKLGPQGR